MPRLARLTAVLALGAALLLAPGAATAATAQNLDDFEIESFDAQWLLTRDADGHARLRVVETIVAIFPDFDQNKGFYRDIPEYRHGVQLHTSVESVVNENGLPVPYETEYYYDFFSVALGDDSYVHGRQTYVITYEQVDVIEAFDDTGADEFYWDVNGTGWAQPFGSVRMTLTVAEELVPALTGAMDCAVLVGECDEFNRVDQPDGSAVFTAAARNLGPNESLTVAIAFELGTFEPGEIVVAPPSNNPDDPWYEPPSFWDTFAPFILAPVGVVISFIAGATQRADRAGRTAPSDIIVPQYTPPKDLNVMLAAYIAGHPERAFAAQVVDLAVKGNVRLLDHPADSSAPFEVQLVHTEGMDDLSRKLATALFGGGLTPGRRVVLRPRNRSLGLQLTGVYQAVDKRLKSDGYQGPARPTALWSVLFGLSLAVAFVAAFDVFRRFMGDADPELSFFAVIIAAFAARATYHRRSTVATLSSRGRRQNDHLLGMRDYMKLAEEDRIRYLQSPEGAERVDVDDQVAMVKLYERLLPYAIIFGIEDKWAKEITVKAEAAAVPLTWWEGSTEFSSWRLNSTIQNLRASSPEPPRPLVAKQAKSSSSSGWGSGGWSSGGSSSGWSGSSGSSFSGGSSGGSFSGGGGGGGGGRGR